MQVHTIILTFLDRFLMQKREVHNGCHKDVHQLQSLLFQRLDSRSDLTVKEEVVIPLTRFLPSAICSSVANTSLKEIGLPKHKAKKKSQCEWYILPTLWVSLLSPDTAFSSTLHSPAWSPRLTGIQQTLLDSINVTVTACFCWSLLESAGVHRNKIKWSWL